MSVEEIIQEIMSRCPDISREQVFRALDEEKKRSAGLIADSTLLRLIAAKRGVEIHSERITNRTLSTRILIPRLNDVTISGRIIATFPPKTFEGKTSGKFARLIIADKDGFLRVMLWNDKVNFLEAGALRAGQIARFSHAYTREDRSGQTELHLGEKSDVETNPQDLKEQDYPSVEETETKINMITHAHQIVNLSGKAKEISAISTFTRQDQTSGKMLRFTLNDETGETTVVAWNERAEELAKIPANNAIVRLVNARVKIGSGNGFEVHADVNTYAEIIIDQRQRIPEE